MTHHPIPTKLVRLFFNGEESTIHSITYSFNIDIEDEGLPGQSLYKQTHTVPNDGAEESHIAGYIALISGLEVLVQWGWEDVRIMAKTHDRVIVNHMRGYWKVLPGQIIPFAKEAQDLAKRFTRLRYWWLDRRENRGVQHNNGGQYHE